MNLLKNLLLSLASTVVFFGGIECLLWAAGVTTLRQERDPLQGFSDRVLVFDEDRANGMYKTSPAAVRQSFNPQQFLLNKPDRGFRLFVLGGSSAFGFPWGASAAFCRILGDALQGSFPDRQIEAVNAAGMSYGTLRIRLLAREVVLYAPDVLVVYEGHNEFVENRLYRELERNRRGAGMLSPALEHVRLYSLIQRWARRFRRAEETPQHGDRSTGELLGLDVVREDAHDTGEEAKQRAAGRLEKNLRAILSTAREHAVPVILCTVACNLRDWAPNQSVFGPLLPDERREAQRLLEEGESALRMGNPATAAERLERARRIAPSHAGIRFQLGRAYEALDRWDGARACYVQARDLDAQPARALSRFNEIIRQVASGPGAVLVDVERAMEQQSPHGLVGFDLIEDYVHPTPRGQRLIARELWKALLEGGLLGAPRTADPGEFERAAGPERSREQLNKQAAEAAPADATRANNLLYNQALVLENQGLLEQAIRKNLECLQLAPNNYMARHNLARLYGLTGRLEEAAEEFRRALRIMPGHVKSLYGLGTALLKLGRPAEAEEAFTEAGRSDAYYAPAWYGLGLALGQQGRLTEAAAAFREATERDQGHVRAWRELGLVLLALGRPVEAVPALRRSLEAEPSDSRARTGLADALARQGQIDEAARLYRALLEDNPSDQHARAALRAISQTVAGR